jgi:hypothetical protein
VKHLVPFLLGLCAGSVQAVDGLTRVGLSGQQSRAGSKSLLTSIAGVSVIDFLLVSIVAASILSITNRSEVRIAWMAILAIPAFLLSLALDSALRHRLHLGSKSELLLHAITLSVLTGALIYLCSLSKVQK